VQITALNDPSRARETASALAAKGFSAYVVEPPTSDPDAPYRVRVGRFATRGEAQAAAVAIGKARGEKGWVIKNADAKLDRDDVSPWRRSQLEPQPAGVNATTEPSRCRS
jgi:SPOR domain